MLIMTGIVIVIFSFLILYKKYILLPFKLKRHKDYNKVAKSIMLLGFLLLSLGIFLHYRDIDVLAIIMVIIIVILILIKIIYNIKISS